MIQMSFTRKPLTALAFVCFALVASNNALATLDPIVPEQVHSTTLRAVTQSLNYDHFRQIDVNDEFSSVVFDHYLESIDPLKLHFTAKDIKKLQRYRLSFDDVIKTGNLAIPFKIYNRYLTKAEIRYRFMLAAVKKKAALDFSLNETLEMDRESVPWPQNNDELEIIWQKQLKEAALRLLLADKPEKEIPALLEKRYKAKLHQLEQINSEDIFQGFMNAVTELYDPHTQYLSPRASDNFNINMSLSLEGIGAVLQTDDEHTKVVRLVPGGPADQSGQIKPLDKIISVGSSKDTLEDIVGWRIDEVVALIRGPKGTDIYLEIQEAKNQNRSTKVIKITRNTVRLEDQAARSDILEINRDQMKYKLGIIEIPAFYADFAGRSKGNKDYRRVSDDVEKILNSPEMRGVNGLVIDLRANGGGSLQEANRLVGLFLKTGPTVQIKNTRNQVSLNRDSDPKIVFDKPLVVLIDRLSASASEIFAGAIQDYERGLVLGSRSFGKGTVQVLRSLDHGQLKMTHAKFYRISGASNQHQGIVPDLKMVSMFDPKDVGESALENALPWDTIKPAQFNTFYNLKPLLPIIQERHRQRISKDVDYQFLIEQSKLLDDIRGNTEITLSYNARTKEKSTLEQKRLDMENNRREAKKLSKLESYEALKTLESKQQEDAAKKIITDQDVVLVEAAEVVADMVDLQSDRLLISNTNTEQEATLFDFFEEMLN